MVHKESVVGYCIFLATGYGHKSLAAFPWPLQNLATGKSMSCLNIEL